MFATVLRKLGGVSAILAAALVVGQQVWGLVSGGLGEGQVESALHAGQMLLMVFGVLGIAVAQQERAGVFASIAAVVAVLGSVTMFAGAFVEVTMLPALVTAGSPLADTPPDVLIVAGIIAFVLWTGGLVLLGISVFVTRQLPRVAAALLAGGVAAGLALNGVVPGILVIYAVGFGWLGYAALTEPRRLMADEIAPRPVAAAH